MFSFRSRPWDIAVQEGRWDCKHDGRSLFPPAADPSEPEGMELPGA